MTTAVAAVQSINWNTLFEPGNVFEGVLWGSFWGVSALLSATSLYDLYKVIVVENPEADRFFKIGKAVKTAFSNFISLCGSTAYNLRWAHDAKILSLAAYAPLVKGLNYGASTLVNLIEGGWSVYNIHREKEAILSEPTEVQREKHKQQLMLSLIKLIENTSMVAWAALGIAGIAAGVTISSFITFPLMLLGGACAFTAFFYQSHIENRHTFFP